MALVCRRDGCKGLGAGIGSAATSGASCTAACVTGIVAPLLRNALASAPAFFIVSNPCCWQVEKCTYIQVYFSNFQRSLSVRLRFGHAKPLGVSVLVGHSLPEHDRADFDALLYKPSGRVLMARSARLHTGQNGAGQFPSGKPDDVESGPHGFEVDQRRLQRDKNEVGRASGGAGRIVRTTGRADDDQIRPIFLSSPKRTLKVRYRR